MQLQGFRKFSGLAGVLLLAVVGYSAQAQQAGLVADLPIRLALQQSHVPCTVFHSP